MEFKIDNRTNANAAIDSFILDGDNSWKHKYIGNAEVPYCDHRNRLICSPAMPPMLNEDDDRMVRAKNEHEAGHAKFTPYGMDESWSRLKCKLVNVVEDLRIERLVGGLSDVFKNDLHWLNDRLIGKIQNKMRTGEKKCKPVDEAIMALHFEGNGHNPEWTMSDDAQALHDSAKAIFDKWTGITGGKSAFPQVLDIVDKIIAIWEKQDTQNGENGQDGQGNNNKQDSNQQNGQGGDNQDDNQQDSQDSQQNKQKNSGSSKQNGGSNDSDNGNSQEENGNDGANSGDKEDESNGIDNEDNADGESNGEAGDGDSNDGDETDGGQYGDNDGQDASSDEEDGEEDNDTSRANNSSVEPSGDACKSNDLLDTDEDSISISEELKEEWEKAVRNSEEVFGEYTSYTDKDTIDKARLNESGYNMARDEVRGAISMITGHLEQSLRTLSRCRTIHGKDMGSLDMSRMAVIAKSLDKNIFTGKTKGISLDVAVSILIDESGSIGSTCYDFRRMAIAFCEALERLGIKFEVLGHTTGYNDDTISGFTRTTPMKIYEHKCFDEPYRNERYRIGSIGSESCNIDGEALLYTVKRLLAQRANRHIVLVLSDGLPNQGENTGALCRHLGNVIELCRRKLGVEVYAFGIGTMEPEKYYGKDNFVYLKNGKELDRGFIGKFSSIIINRKM